MANNIRKGYKVWCICCHDSGSTLHKLGEVHICKTCKETLTSKGEVNICDGRGKLVLSTKDKSLVEFVPSVETGIAESSKP